MQVYLVGGAVRDALLGLPVRERDWVVVGATRDDMARMGYREVGRDFPVFLHPQTHEEYALARLERKVAPGISRIRSAIRSGGHARGGPCAARPDDQRDRARGRRHARRPLRRPPRYRRTPVAPRLRCIRRGSGARAACRALRGALRAVGVSNRRRDDGADARDRGARRSRRARRRARLAGNREGACASRRPAEFFRVLRDCGALRFVYPEIDALFGVPQPAQWHPGDRHRCAHADGVGSGGALEPGPESAVRGAHARSRQGADPAFRMAAAISATRSAASR